MTKGIRLVPREDINKLDLIIKKIDLIFKLVEVLTDGLPTQEEIREEEEDFTAFPPLKKIKKDTENQESEEMESHHCS